MMGAVCMIGLHIMKSVCNSSVTKEKKALDDDVRNTGMVNLTVSLACIKECKNQNDVIHENVGALLSALSLEITKLEEDISECNREEIRIGRDLKRKENAMGAMSLRDANAGLRDIQVLEVSRNQNQRKRTQKQEEKNKKDSILQAIGSRGGYGSDLNDSSETIQKRIGTIQKFFEEAVKNLADSEQGSSVLVSALYECERVRHQAFRLDFISPSPQSGENKESEAKLVSKVSFS